MVTNNIIKNTERLKEYLSHSSNRPDEYYFVKTDNAFTRKARLLQAIHRKLSGAACGSFVRQGITYFHPNLAKGGEKSGCNFLRTDIFEYAKERIRNKKSYETIEEDRLFNNFLSSQPMAFNLFVPLMKIVKTNEGQIQLASVVSSLLDPQRKIGIHRIVEVGLEFIPDYYSECLNDKTAMDAFFRYERVDGGKGIIAIETKYTDKLGTNQASNPTLAIKTITTRVGISELFTAIGKEQIISGKILLCQIYRNFLLTETIRLHENLVDSLSVVLAPKDNTSNDEDEKELENILCNKNKYKFKVLTLETFVSFLIDKFTEEEAFKKFWYRYLDFTPVETLLNSRNI